MQKKFFEACSCGFGNDPYRIRVAHGLADHFRETEKDRPHHMQVKIEVWKP